MTDLSTPYAPPISETDAAHAHPHPPHLSPWPLFLGFTTPVLFLGFVFLPTTPIVLVVGLILVLMGLIGWVREDTLSFPAGPNPLTQHTVGQKDTIWWGILLFLCTEVVLFGALFAVFFAARSDPGFGPPAGVHLPVPVTAINTAILIASGVVMHFGEFFLKRGNRRGFLLGFGGAVALGLVFLVIQATEYFALIDEGLTFGTGVYGSTFYILTGTHGLHVFGGIVLLTIVFIRGLKGQFDDKRHSYVTASALYWHFVDVVWVLLFAIVYLGVI